MIIIVLTSSISAVWYNPFTWFGDDKKEQEISKGNIKIEYSHSEWICQTNPDDEYDCVIEDKNKEKTIISFCHKTIKKSEDTGKKQLPNKKDICLDKECNEKVELSKKNKKSDKLGEEDLVCYERLTDTEEYLKFNPTAVYQNVSMVQYINPDLDLEINTTIEEGLSDRTGYATNYPNVLIVDSESFKFGAEAYNKTNHTEFRYIFESNKPMYKDAFSYYFKGDIIQGLLTNTQEKIRINVDDICYTSYNETTNTTFNSNCEYNYTSNEIDENTTNYRLEVYFTAEYKGNSTIFIDPSYSIDSETFINSVDTNITQENNFSHLEINDNSPYDSSVLYMPFDDNVSSTTAYDYSDNNYDGSLQGNTHSVDGLYGKAMYFDNSGDTITVGDISFSPNSNVTICAWVNGSSFLTDNIISDNSKIFFRTLSSGRLEFIILGLNDDRITSSFGGDGVLLDVGVWTHVCGMYNGTYFSLWENGAFSLADDTGGSWTDSTGTYNIGGRSVASENWHGNIDELMVFSTSLTSQQIQEIYNNQSARFKPTGTQEIQAVEITAGNNTLNVTTDYQTNLDSGLSLRIGEWDISRGYNDSVDGTIESNMIAYYHFDNRSGYNNSTYVYDFSGNGYHGLIENDATYSTIGKYNNSMAFDGINDRVVIGDIGLIGDTEHTASIWFKNDDTSTTADRGILNHDTMADYKIFWGANELISFNLDTNESSDRTVRSDSTYTDTDWHNVIAVYNSTHIYMYIDGVLQTEILEMTGAIESANDIDIGGSVTEFDGNLDEIMIWNRSLSEKEISEIYVKGKLKYDYSSYQEVTGENQYSISTNTTHILTDYKFEGGNSTSNPFYSPILFANIDLETYDTEEGEDTTPPTFTDIANITEDNETAVYYDINATDDVEIDMFFINDTSNFKIDSSTGVFENNTILSVGVYAVNVSVNDTSSNLASEVIEVNITAVELEEDDNYPIFSNIVEIPSDPDTYDYTQTYRINVTIEYTNGTAYIDVLGNNYSLSNNSNVYYLEGFTLGAETYDYYFWAYGNGTENNINTSSTFDYTVNKANPELGSITGTSPITYGTAGDVEGTETNQGDGDLTYKLYRNSTEVSNPDTTTLAAGYYYYVYNTTGGENYTTDDNLDEFYLTVNKATAETSLVFDKSSPQEYETTINASCSLVSGEGTIKLYRDGVDVTAEENNQDVTLGVGTYNYTCNITETQNYTSASNSSNFTITQNDSYVLSLTGTSPITYGTAGDFEGSGCPAQLTCNLYRNLTEVSNPDTTILAVGTYNYTYNTTGNTNYSSKSVSDILVVNKASSEVNLTIDGESSNKTIPQGTSINLNCPTITGDSSATLELYNNGSLINTGTSPIGNLTTFNDVGEFNISCYYLESENYTISSETYYVNVTFEDTESPIFTDIEDINVNYPESIYYDINATDDVEIDKFSINDTDNFKINSDTGVFENNTILGVGVYDVNVTVNDTSGNENSSIITITINENIGSCDVLFNETSPITYPNTFTVFTNCNSDFTLRRNGTIISNNSEQVLGAETYNFSVQRTDTENYTNTYDDEDFTIDKATPTGTITGEGTYTYPYESTIEGTETNTGDGDCSYKLYRDNVEVSNPETVTLGVATYNYTYNVSGCSNYTDTPLDSVNLIINQNSTYTLDITASPDWDVETGTETTITGIGCPAQLTCNLYREGSLVSNPDVQTLSEGVYTYVYNTTGNTNYSSKSTTDDLNVSTTIDETPPTFTNLENKTGYVNESFTYDVNAEDDVELDEFSLNDTSVFDINVNTGVITNVTALTEINIYWLNITINDTSGNTASEVFYINITERPPAVITGLTVDDMYILYNFEDDVKGDMRFNYGWEM